MQPEGSLPSTKQPAICPYPEPDQSCQRPHLYSEVLFLYYPPIYVWVFQVSFFLHVAPPKPLCTFLHRCYMPQSVSLFSI